MPLTVQRMTADIAVAGQLDPAAMAEAAAAGFRSVVNNRPDFEGGPAQPTSASIEAAALAAGLSYAFLPVASNVQTTGRLPLAATVPCVGSSVSHGMSLNAHARDSPDSTLKTI